MFNTSKDILFLVIAVSVAVLVFFISWSLYYLTKILKGVNEVVREFKNRVMEFNEILHTIKEKMGHSVSYLALIAKGISSFRNYVQEKKRSKKK